MSALYSAQGTGTTSTRREHRAGPGEWRAEALVRQAAANDTIITPAPGEDGSVPLVSSRAEWVYIIAGLIIAGLVLAGRVFGWLA